jgi:HK97 family phage major capsid protein
MQVEAQAKAEQILDFEARSEQVRTVSHWLPCTCQVIEDMSELANFINDSLLYYLGLEEELQFLFASGSGADLHGLVPQASSFNVGLLGSGSFTQIDVISAAIQQIMEAKEIAPTFAVLNPRDW